MDNAEDKYDLILNCAFVYAFQHYQKLCRMLGRKAKGKSISVNDAIVRNFYDQEKDWIWLCVERVM